MLLKQRIAQTLQPVTDLIYPPRCPLCGLGIEAQSGLCGECWSELSIPGEPACSTCQLPLPIEAAQGALQCGACLKNAPRHDGIAAATIYNDASRKLILAFKHGGRIAMAPMLAQLIHTRLSNAADNALLVPVPLHRMRLWHRGFNQSALLARELMKLGAGELIVDGLVRKKSTPSLGGLGANERKRILQGAITANPRRVPKIQGRNVILVDDVLTSGATSNACVKALKKIGAKKVQIASFARVVAGK